MNKLILGSIFFSLFLVGCSSTQPQEEVVVQDTVVEEVVVATPEPVEAPVQALPKPWLDK